jgi:hypothetical protein
VKLGLEKGCQVLSDALNLCTLLTKCDQHRLLLLLPVLSAGQGAGLGTSTGQGSGVQGTGVSGGTGGGIGIGGGGTVGGAGPGSR